MDLILLFTCRNRSNCDPSNYCLGVHFGSLLTIQRSFSILSGLCFHVLSVLACHSHTRVCRTSSIPFPIACSTAYLSLNAPLSSVSLLLLLSLPLLVALLCITNLRFQFMMGICIAIILRL